MNATLEFPPIDETMAEQTRSAVVAAPEPAQDLATMDLKTIALSGFYPHSRQAEEAKAASRRPRSSCRLPRFSNAGT